MVKTTIKHEEEMTNKSYWTKWNLPTKKAALRSQWQTFFISHITADLTTGLWLQATFDCWRDVSLKPAQPLKVTGCPRRELTFVSLQWDRSRQPARWQVSVNKISKSSSWQRGGKVASLHVFCVYTLFSQMSAGKQTFSPRRSFFVVVVQQCIRHICVNYWNRVVVFFFSLLLRDRLQELAVTRFFLLVKKKKKFRTWRGPGNQQIDVGSGQWMSNSLRGPTQSVQKKRAFTDSTFQAPIWVSSNYPCPVHSHTLKNSQRKSCLGNNERELCSHFSHTPINKLILMFRYICMKFNCCITIFNKITFIVAYELIW